MLRVVCLANDTTKIRYGLDQLRQALSKHQYAISIEFLAPTPGSRLAIGLALTPDQVVTQTSSAQAGASEALGPEGFNLRKAGTGDAIATLVEAEDEQGVLYGCLDLVEQLEVRAPEQIQAKTERALIPFRGAKCNLPWEAYQAGYSTEINQDVYWDLAVWERYLDRLARGRFNVLTLWSQHPYHLMVRIPKYPEACPYPEAEMEGKIRFWKALFAMAKARGLKIYMLTWNIHLHEHFARRRGFPVSGYDHPVIRDYLREALKALIATYDDLDGFGTNPGERMHDFRPGAFEDFILDVYVKALKEANRQVPFILRSNWLPPEATRAAVEKAAYPGPVFIDWKFNTSHGLSTWKLKGRDTNRFLNPPPDTYRMLWHVRNEEAYLLQWGDPAFVAAHAQHNYDSRIVAGYFFGPERVLPFLEEVRLDSAGRRIQTYDFDRRWYLYEIWGRMGYNPDTPASFWRERLNRYYGLPAEDDSLYQGLRAASQVALEFNTFWAGSWDGTAYAEGNLGFHPGVDSWDGNREKRFISVTDFIFHECLDSDYMTIPEHVVAVLGDPTSAEPFERAIEGRVTPFDVAQRMEASQAQVGACLETLRNSSGSTDAQRSRELVWLSEDLTIWSGLAGYYAHKLRASTYLYAFMYSGDEQLRERACSELTQASAYWERLAEFTRERIARQAYDHFDVFHWERYVDDARGDIALARRIKPVDELAREIRCYRLGPYPSDGWGASIDRPEAPERALYASEARDRSQQIEQYLSAAYSIAGREYRWQPLPALSPSIEVLKSDTPLQMVHELRKRYDLRVDFESEFGRSGTIYFAAVVLVDEDEAVEYELRTRDFARVWINGTEVFHSPKAKWYTEGRRGGRFAALLRAGSNLIVIKLEATRPLSAAVETVVDDPQGWGFYLQKGFAGYPFRRHHEFPYQRRSSGRG